MTTLGQHAETANTVPVAATGGDEETRARDTARVLREWVRRLRSAGRIPSRRRTER